jgi:membrane protease YdiL (CAAX protease family)
MSFDEIVRLGGPLLAALGAAILVDTVTRRRGLDPPGFALESSGPARRAAAISLVGFTFYVAVFSALGTVGRQSAPSLEGISDWQLFLLQALFVLTLLGWFALGFAGTGPRSTPPAPGRGLVARFAVQFGFATPNPWREVGIGVVAGLGAWLAVIAGMLVFAAIVAGLFGEELLPQAPPAVIPWIAGRPVLLRLGIAVAAGLVEEAFFRGFLQARVGIGLSTLLFALAHLSYDQPIMLVGITMLSLFYGLLVRWRRNLLPAIVAHFLFDAIQLLVVIPAVLKLVYAEPGVE